MQFVHIKPLLPWAALVGAAGVLIDGAANHRPERAIGTIAQIERVDERDQASIGFVDAAGSAQQVRLRYAPRRGVSVPVGAPGVEVELAYARRAPEDAMLLGHYRSDLWTRAVLLGTLVVLFVTLRRRVSG